MKPVMNIAAFLLLQLLAIAAIKISFCNGSTYVGCIKSEREALLSFKQDLIDPANRLVSWVGDGDCCTWVGVVCNNLTGNVLEIRLRNLFLDCQPFDDYKGFQYWSELGGKINPSLLDIKHLNYLDLSGNNFIRRQIPRFLGSMENLRYLNLYHGGFVGMIPHQLGNLSNLQYLNLGSNKYGDVYVQNFRWLSGLSLLEYLDLSYVNLGKAIEELPESLPSLLELHLSNCQLHHFPQLSTANFSSLVTLDLRDNSFQGSVPDGLQNLTSLRYLDLSYNNFNSTISNWLYRLCSLEDLYLRSNNWQGTVTETLGNLTSLKTLDLSYSSFEGGTPILLKNFCNLISLKTLDLSFSSFEGRTPILVGNFCHLTSLETLDLSSSSFEGGIPISFGNFCNLRSISMSYINLNQEISEVLEIFSKCVSNGLEFLDLSGSHLSGYLTDRLGKFKKLNSLYLCNNSISGPIPSSLGELSSLEYLDLSDNKLNGTLSEVHFNNLTRLSYFWASRNSLMFKVSPNWIPPFKLEELRLGSCHLGPLFPSWLHSQKYLQFLDISNSGILDTLPIYLFKFPSQSLYLNLSHNQIYGNIPNLTESTQLDSLDLSSNNLSGPLPLIPFNMHVLDLSNNNLSGSISHFLCYEMNESQRLMQFLILTENFFYGDIPDCWMNWQKLIVLKLDNNKFTGNLPSSIGTLSFLQSLHLQNNNLSGTLPMSLKNCTQLKALDASDNEFVGNLPAWIGESLSTLKFLYLRSNKFHGFFPMELCQLSSLQILDLADNKFSGAIPSCIKNFRSMANKSYSLDQMDGNYVEYWSDAVFSRDHFLEDASLMMKGRILEYSTILNLIRFIDLSKNNFSGEIPVELTKLGALKSLNLSYNHFTGRIPASIGVMGSLESIDLSGNNLSGEIPQSISNLSFLSCLNLSNNNLVGKIPSGTQLQGFNASCFTGNKLCGLPLGKNCIVTVPTSKDDNGGGKYGNEHEVDWFYISMALGFMVGFWAVISPLLISIRWRFMYYHFLDNLWSKFGSVVRKYY